MNPIITLVLSYAILSVGAVPNTRSFMLLLRQKVPLQLHYCKDLGYKQTTAINFMKEDQKEAEKSNLFRTLVLLEKLGYSDLLKGYICAIYAPVYLPKLGTALPPCRSLCQNVKKACWNGFVPYIFRKSPFYCNLYPNPNEQYGCIDYKYDEDAALLVRRIKGDPEKLLDDWKIPKY